jgi:Arc/MetJ-type ribon-helix-helix transcriptional regulator
MVNMGERPISVRLDGAAQEALDLLVSEGSSQSEAIRTALVEAAARRRDRSLRAEALRLAGDPADRAEKAALLAEMEELRAPW